MYVNLSRGGPPKHSSHPCYGYMLHVVSAIRFPYPRFRQPRFSPWSPMSRLRATSRGDHARENGGNPILHVPRGRPKFLVLQFCCLQVFGMRRARPVLKFVPIILEYRLFYFIKLSDDIQKIGIFQSSHSHGNFLCPDLAHAASDELITIASVCARA